MSIKQTIETRQSLDINDNQVCTAPLLLALPPLIATSHQLCDALGELKIAKQPALQAKVLALQKQFDEEQAELEKRINLSQFLNLSLRHLT
ncbi:hypothetical protein F9L16_17765 [Agarivorans sp. B2Z047]|uniref:hypothetical protein n=1 Tax=Agarivorans sp. B2Z047 TaxID=2652721 RepID=UPI00128CB111|nr:hypothetical protein [Agarivorans sp. B2Z047]MPW30836.1 hypothetical protein [Agarivorans sp. B2Z047]UQN40933.1 hypothetical protein LQZ07_14240 [Agarivorans sp. B2Z047]